MSEERLRQFFIKDQGGYRVKREVRGMVLFALHDVIKDPPFSQLDLISCRNLLIYLNEHAQKRALDTFHFGLRAEGVLFLGASESVADGARLFTPLDKKHRLYIRRTALSGTLPMLSRPPSLGLEITPPSTDPSPLAKTHVSAEARSHHAPYPRWTNPEASLAALHLKLIESMAPPSVVVDREHNVIHLSERAGRYLRFGGGKSTLNLLDVVHPKVRVELRTALYRAGQIAGLVEIRIWRWRSTVHRVHSGQRGYRTSVWRFGSWAGHFESDQRGSWGFFDCRKRGSCKGSNLHSRVAIVSCHGCQGRGKRLPVCVSAPVISILCAYL